MMSESTDGSQQPQPADALPVLEAELLGAATFLLTGPQRQTFDADWAQDRHSHSVLQVTADGRTSRIKQSLRL